MKTSRLLCRSTVVMTMALGALGAASASGDPASTRSYQGSAYAVGIVSSHANWTGRAASTALGCTPKSGHDDLTFVHTLEVPALLSTGAISANTMLSTSASDDSVTSSTVVSYASLLSGRIVIRGLRTESISYVDRGTFGLDGSGDSIDSLIVDGRAVRARTGSVAVRGVGTIILGSRSEVYAPQGDTGYVTAFELVVGPNGLGVPPGTTVVLGHASSSLTSSADSVPLSGSAYGTWRTDGSSDPMPGPGIQTGMCDGTSGATYRNSLPQSRIPGVLTTGAVTVTASGTVKNGFPSGSTTSSVAKLDMYRGFITANLITARASVSGSDAEPRVSGTISGLVIAGRKYPNPEPDTVVRLPNLRISLHVVLTGSGDASVAMLVIRSTGANRLHLFPRHTVTVGFADIGS